jgi:tetratricopeptide (TPR) repeat protein/transcriptional regulator with XRE-family HTH domain
MTDLGDELRRLLAEHDMSLSGAARQAGCSKGYLSNVAQGRKSLTPRVAAGLDRLFGTGDTFGAYARNSPPDGGVGQPGRPGPRGAADHASGVPRPRGDAAGTELSARRGPGRAGPLLSSRSSAAEIQPRPLRQLPGSPDAGDSLLRAGRLPGITDLDGWGLQPEWPAWFGIRLAHLITVTDGWHDPSQLGSLQSLLNQEILMSDAAVPHDQHQLKTLHAVSRRQALMTLAALPAALAGPVTTTARMTVSGAGGPELFLARCAASLASCWHLLRGSDLPGVEQLLSAYLLPLEAAARRRSRYQPAAARLATQAQRICGILALHRNQLSVREHYCKRALQYASITSDASSHASALISLASTYFYASDPLQAAALYEQAFSHGAALPALQRSRVHAELAVVYGQLGREQDAIRATGQAEELYPDDPQDDPSFLYAEFTPASLTLERGLAYVALAEQFPGRGFEQKAAGIFGQAQADRAGSPDRIRFEIINHQASTAVLLGDLDAFETHMMSGHDGASQLGSRQRLREMRTIWDHALVRWPGEQRLKDLGGSLVLARTGEEPA